MSVKTIETKAVISAEDRTGGVFGQVVRKLSQLEAQTRRVQQRASAADRVTAADRRMDPVRHMAAALVYERAAAKFEQAAHAILHTYREFDKERRYAKAVMGITDAQQAPLIKQAIHGGATSKYNDIQWLEAQRELAARGLGVDQVLALTQVAATIGQAMDRNLPDSVKALEGAMFGFGKDVSSFDKALANAQRTADLQVKASKISGMNYDDIVEAYKFGAAPFRMAGLSEEDLLVLAGIGKKSNMPGSEMGVMARALAANLMKPTQGARTAMMSAGIDYTKYQGGAQRPMSADMFGNLTSQYFGVELNAKVKAGLQKIFDNPELVNDANKFMPAVMGLAKGEFKGKQGAKDMKAVASFIRQYRDSAMGGVDGPRLFHDIMVAMAKNPALANALLGSKQGARMMASMGDPDLFIKKMDELLNHSLGFAEQISKERMAGFDGAVSRFQNAAMNVETAMGRSLDNDGKGGILTSLADAAARATQAFAEMPPVAHQVAAGLGILVTGLAGAAAIKNFTSGFGLQSSAVALDGAAAELSAAAVKLGGGSGIPGGSPGGAPGGGGIQGVFGRGLLLGMATLGAIMQMPKPGTPEWDKWGAANDKMNDDWNSWAKEHLPWWLQPHDDNRWPFGSGKATAAPRWGSKDPSGGARLDAPGALPPVGSGLDMFGFGPKGQKVGEAAPQRLTIEPIGPLKVEVFASSALLEIVKKFESVGFKANGAPGGVGETTTEQ